MLVGSSPKPLTPSIPYVRKACLRQTNHKSLITNHAASSPRTFHPSPFHFSLLTAALAAHRVSQYKIRVFFGFMINRWQIGDQIDDHNRGELRGHPEASWGGILSQLPLSLCAAAVPLTERDGPLQEKIIEYARGTDCGCMLPHRRRNNQ